MSWIRSWLQSGAWRRRSLSRSGCEPGGESGQALIELALGMTLLTAILLGGLQFGQIMYTWINVSNAAKAGVQYGTHDPSTAVDGTGISNAAMAAAPSLSSMTVTSSFACVCSDGSASDCSSASCPTSHKIQTLTVNTSYTLSTWVRVPGFGNSFTMTGQAVQRCMN